MNSLSGLWKQYILGHFGEILVVSVVVVPYFYCMILILIFSSVSHSKTNQALDGGEGGPLRKIASLLLPLSALAFGIIYATDPSVDKYFLPLAIVAASPVALTIIADQKGSKEAVLLPLIDSANHLQEADSVIEYDPAVDGFVLSLGRKCLVKEVDEAGERAQVR